MTDRPSTLRARTRMDRSAVTLSVLIPVYNERDTVDLIVEQVRATPIPLEIICVDDCSTDGTQQILETLLAQGRINQLYRQPVNRGKGAAICHALGMSTGDIVIVQDADLEYDPADWPTLLEPILDGRAARTACSTTGIPWAIPC
jgi:glycosyltransferase involved in cell wall biosynthesis